MARPVPCDLCGQTTADFVVTVITDGSVMGVGIECFEEWSRAIVDAYHEYQEGQSGAAEASPDPAETVGEGWEYDRPDPHPKSDQEDEEGPGAAVTDEEAQAPPSDVHS